MTSSNKMSSSFQLFGLVTTAAVGAVCGVRITRTDLDHPASSSTSDLDNGDNNDDSGDGINSVDIDMEILADEVGNPAPAAAESVVAKSVDPRKYACCAVSLVVLCSSILSVVMLQPNKPFDPKQCSNYGTDDADGCNSHAVCTMKKMVQHTETFEVPSTAPLPPDFTSASGPLANRLNIYYGLGLEVYGAGSDPINMIGWVVPGEWADQHTDLGNHQVRGGGRDGDVIWALETHNASGIPKRYLTETIDDLALALNASAGEDNVTFMVRFEPNLATQRSTCVPADCSEFENLQEYGTELPSHCYWTEGKCKPVTGTGVVDIGNVTDAATSSDVDAGSVASDNNHLAAIQTHEAKQQ